MSELAQPVSPDKEEGKKKIESYEVDNAVDCLLRAEEVKRNKPLMKLVLKKLDDKKSAITSLQELRSIAADKMKE